MHFCAIVWSSSTDIFLNSIPSDSEEAAPPDENLTEENLIDLDDFDTAPVPDTQPAVSQKQTEAENETGLWYRNAT